MSPVRCGQNYSDWRPDTTGLRPTRRAVLYGISFQYDAHWKMDQRDRRRRAVAARRPGAAGPGACCRATRRWRPRSARASRRLPASACRSARRTGRCGRRPWWCSAISRPRRRARSPCAASSCGRSSAALWGRRIAVDIVEVEGAVLPRASVRAFRGRWKWGDADNGAGRRVEPGRDSARSPAPARRGVDRPPRHRAGLRRRPALRSAAGARARPRCRAAARRPPRACASSAKASRTAGAC